MRVVIANSNWWLGDQLVARLEKDGNKILPLDMNAELNHDDTTDKLSEGANALVIFGYPEESGDPSFLIDRNTRRIYNLLHAVSEAGATRCVYVSSLMLFSDYEENLTVTEQWRSLPPSSDPALLACHLGEIVCKEFARDRRIEVANLRIGFPIVDGDKTKAEKSGETAAVASTEVTDAIVNILGLKSLTNSDRWTLSKRMPYIQNIWRDIHLQSKITNQRYLTHVADEMFGS